MREGGGVHFRIDHPQEKGGDMSGPQCCENPPSLDPSSGSGHVEKLGGLNTYISGSPDSSDLAILLISEVFGYEAPKLRKLADKIAAAAGLYVVVPDFFHGDPHIDNDPRSLQEWLKIHGPDKGFEDAKPVVEALKTKGFSAIGAAGFCWGAKVVVQLAKHKFIRAAVLLHPSFVTLDDIKGVAVPIAILGAEVDHFSPPSLLKQFEELLSTKSEVKRRKTSKERDVNEISISINGLLDSNQVSSLVKIFPKVAHGWTIRYNDEDEGAVKCAEESHEDMLNWFAKHVK